LKYLAKNLLFLRSKKGLSQAEMSHQLGFSRTAWNNYENQRSTPVLDDFVRIAKYFGVGASDLLDSDLSKEGNLILDSKSTKNKLTRNLKGNLKGNLSAEIPASQVNEPEVKYEVGRMPHVITVDTQGNENVIYVPVRARAGYLNGYSDPEFMSSLPTYRLPGLNNGTFRMFEVDGLSMYQTLHDRDIIIGSFVDQWRDVRDDRVHIIMTKNDGVVVKRVLNRFEKEGKFILKSDNYKDRDMYPPIICEAQDILEIWYGIAYISRQMRPPTETYKRVVDLEGRFTLLEDFVKKGIDRK
jgi:transcriptional regulator with XRE-family HTH domain